MTDAKIKSKPDSELQYRSQTIQANNKTLVTPIKSIDHTKLDSTVQISKRISGLNEIYFGLSHDKISKHLQGIEHTLDYSLNSFQRKIRDPSSEIQLCFLEYKEEGFPNSKEIGFMTDQAYVYSDITPIPMLSNFKYRVSDVSTTKGKNEQDKEQTLPSQSKFEKFLKYLSDVIETIEQRNNKPIMGYIPDYRFFFPELIDFYVKKGINTFYYDAHGSSPMTVQSTLRSLLRELSAEEALENSFIHILNPNYGRSAKDSSIIPAKDILGFGLGIDSLGEKHIPLKFRPILTEDMKKNPDNRSRLFDKNSYGYIKTSERKVIEEFYPNDSGIDITNFLTTTKPSNKMQNSFNMEQLGLEAIKVKERIMEARPILAYIEKKKNVKEDDLKVLKKFKIPLKK